MKATRIFVTFDWILKDIFLSEQLLMTSFVFILLKAY